MRRVLIVLLAVLLALSAHAAVNVTLSLPDDAPALLRAACARANGGATPGACSAPEAAAWFSAQIDSRVLPEMSAKINFLPSNQSAEEVSTKTVLTVPSAAIVTRNGSKIVFVAKQGKVIARTIETGQTYGGVVEVRSGVEMGDAVVLTPPEGMADGDAIKLKS